MKKLLVIFIIISILTLNLKIDSVNAQDVNNNSIDFSSYYLQCEIPKPLTIEEFEVATETVEYVNEFENFSGKDLKPPGFFEGLIQGLIAEVVSSLVGDLMNSLIGKVPVGASEVNLDIRNSIKEATKNITASIKASIQLAIKDALEYFKFKLISKINDFIYNKILKNYISDINLYRNFRLFLAQQKAINRALNKYKNLPCIPDDFKWCFVSVLRNFNISSLNLASQSENADKLIKYFRAFMKLQELNIIGKQSCESEEEEMLFYQQAGLETPIYSTAEGSWYEETSVSAALNTKPKNLITKIEREPRNIFANIFNFFNSIKRNKFLAQFYLPQDIESYSGKIFFPFIEKINTEINLRNCSYLISQQLAVIDKELAKEKEKLDIQFQQPGGFTFKPKTECLKTWTEIEREETMKNLAQAMEEGDTVKVQQLSRTIEELDKIISQQKDITGDDPRCLIPGPTLSAPSDYEKLKEEILTSPLEFFKSQERAVNTLVAFIRAWLSTKLFKIIDKGFASLESRKAKNEILTDIKNAYSKEKIEKICSKTEYLGTPGLTQSCKDTLESQLVKTTEIAQNEISNAIRKTSKILNTLTSVLTNLNEMHSKVNDFYDELNEYLNAQNLSLSEEKLIQLEQLKYQFNKNLEEARNIQSSLPTSTLEELDNIKNILNSATITALKKEIASTSKKIEELEQVLGAELKSLNFEITKLYNIGYNNKLMTFFMDYPDIKKLISNSKDCVPFPAYYIFYYDESQGGNRQDKIIAKSCSYLDTYPNLEEEIKLSFYKRFYPTHLFNLGRYQLTYNWIEQRYEKSKVDIEGDGEDKIPASTNRYASIYLIAHDLLIIFYSLYGSAQTTIDQGYFLNSLNSHINNIISGNFDPKQLNTIRVEIESYLIPYFEKIETYASNTIQYTKNSTTTMGTLLYEFNFRYSAEPNRLTRAIALKLGEALEYLKDLASSYKNILLKINELILNRGTQISELAILKNQLNDLNKKLEEEITQVWGIYLSKLNEDEINRITNELENNIDQINNIINDNYQLCQDYNQLIKDIEEELKAAPPEVNPSLPESETETYEIQKETKFSLLRRFLDITKNLLASIFNVFNIFKPKKIYIK